ncbi:MAG: hypothetical protein HC905_19800 [Bacteroidales bacterium]|nr:hypothetical protein [Bacteroidales bacterium]
MENTIKVIITSKKNLEAKYTSDFSTIEELIAALVKSDLKRKIQTEIIYIDNADSARKAGIKPVSSVTRLTAKRAVDAIYEKLKPAYTVLLGAQDVFPFQEIKNPASDDDVTVPTDLPYACNAPYSTNISKFTGPTRVVGRIPDIPGKADIQYLTHVINAVINFKNKKEEEMADYFSVTAAVWEKSTRQSLVNIFGNSQNMLKSPPAKAGFNPEDLKAPVHFFNCHGAPVDARYYGQQGNKFPPAFSSADLAVKTQGGVVVAAECCYGAQLYDPASEDANLMSIANAYFKDNAVAFVGSSNIAYGPAESQGLADLITQYFIRNILDGSSCGRAMLEARHKFFVCKWSATRSLRTENTGAILFTRRSFHSSRDNR